MSQASARFNDRLVGEVRETATGTSMSAALRSISELMRPVVSKILSAVGMPRFRHLPRILSNVLCRPTSSATTSRRWPSPKAEVCTPWLRR